MVLFMKRILLLATLLCVPSFHAADPPNKRGRGFFGFGAQKTEQISAGLFPQRGEEFAAPAASSRADADGIFRSGQPNPVDEVSYVIQNGRKIERPVEATSATSPSEETASPPVVTAMDASSGNGVELASDDGRKKGGLFAFVRRGSGGEENEVVTPVPAAPPRAIATNADTEKVDAPDFAEEAKEKTGRFGWIPFLSRRKHEPATEGESPAPVVATAQPVPAAVPVAAPNPAPAAPAKPAPAAAPKPAPASTSEVASTTFEVPRNDAKKEEKASAPGNGILSPIANIRPPRKEIDLSSAETIIQDGEIVAGSETNFESVTESEGGGRRQAPQIVNGVKTYSSWDDVAASSSSAADRIIRSMR